MGGNWTHSASLARFQPCQQPPVSLLIVAEVGSTGIWETEEQRQIWKSLDAVCSEGWQELVALHNCHIGHVEC